MLQALTLTASLRWTATCPKWLKKATCRRKYVLRVKSLSHGARNGRRIGTMSVFVQTVAAGHVEVAVSQSAAGYGRRWRADIGLEAYSCT
jgi:hypothetical protein